MKRNQEIKNRCKSTTSIIRQVGKARKRCRAKEDKVFVRKRNEIVNENVFKGRIWIILWRTFKVRKVAWFRRRRRRRLSFSSLSQSQSRLSAGIRIYRMSTKRRNRLKIPKTMPKISIADRQSRSWATKVVVEPPRRRAGENWEILILSSPFDWLLWLVNTTRAKKRRRSLLMNCF